MVEETSQTEIGAEATRNPADASAGSDPTGGIAARRGEPDWLQDSRRGAWAAFEEAPLPDRVTHLWRYTDPGKFLPANGRPTSSSGPDSVADEASWPAEIRREIDEERLSGAAYSLGGRVQAIRLSSELESRGVVLADLHDAALRFEDVVRRCLGKAVGRDHGKFEALNEAVWQGGLLLYVPPRVSIERPIHVAMRPASSGGFLAPRLLVVLEDDASATLVDDYIARKEGSGEMQVNVTSEVLLGDRSHLRHVTVQQLGPRSQFYLTSRARVGGDGRYLGVLASLGAAAAKVDVGAVLAGKGAESEMMGVALGHKDQHFDHHTVHDHHSGHTYSNLDFKVVLQDRARSTYTGLIRIAPKADSSEAYQENRNLLLSGEAKAESIPELEILTDEVRCSHGATMGPVDDEHLFYLMSRGIPRAEALRMVVGGFIEPTLRALPTDLKERVTSYVDDRLEEL